MIVCTRRLEFDAMHRIPLHESKCKAFHGHRYAAEITCVADELDSLGRVVDFGVIKARVGTWIDTHWDHTAILMRGDDDPAVQNFGTIKCQSWPTCLLVGKNIQQLKISQQSWEEISTELLKDTGVVVQRVRLWETPNAWVEWSA